MVDQKESFDGDQHASLRTLHAYTDKAGLIRVRTKILNRQDNYSFRCPVVLDSRHTTTRRLIQGTHKKMCHAVVQTLMSHLRERCWLINMRRGIRAVISHCMICKKQSAKHMESMGPPSPEDRVKDASVFEVTGIDLAGPIFLTGGRKAWICLFTCAVYRAVYRAVDLELLTLASTKDFL